jgi:hypothetical protein
MPNGRHDRERRTDEGAGYLRDEFFARVRVAAAGEGLWLSFADTQVPVTVSAIISVELWSTRSVALRN